MTRNNSLGLGKQYCWSLANFSDNFVSYVYVKLGDLNKLEYFSKDRQANLLIEASFQSLKKDQESNNEVTSQQGALGTYRCNFVQNKLECSIKTVISLKQLVPETSF